MGPRVGFYRWLPPLLAAAALCAGCGGGSPPVTFGVGAKAEWTKHPATPGDVGYTITVAAVVLQLNKDSSCDRPPSSTHLFINGQEAKLDLETDDACMGGGAVLGPLLHDQTVTVTLEESGEVTATASFKNLLPGTAATMTGPAELHEGDDIVIRPVPEIPDTSSTALTTFYLLDAPTWNPFGTIAKALPKRSDDGLHVPAPAFAGRAIMAVWNVTSECDQQAGEVSCSGFGRCLADNACALGPFFVTGAP